MLGHQAEANLPSLGEKPQRAGVYMGCGGNAHMTRDFTKKLFLSELLHPLVQRRAQAFRFPSRLKTEGQPSGRGEDKNYPRVVKEREQLNNGQGGNHK